VDGREVDWRVYPELAAAGLWCTPTDLVHFARVIQDAVAGEATALLPRHPEVQDAFNAWVQSASRTSVWETGCHNWYTTASGRNTNNWPTQTFMYRYRVRRFDLAAYRVMPVMAGTGAA
jgi:hypothetical protein